MEHDVERLGGATLDAPLECLPGLELPEVELAGQELAGAVEPFRRVVDGHDLDRLTRLRCVQPQDVRGESGAEVDDSASSATFLHITSRTAEASSEAGMPYSETVDV